MPKNPPLFRDLPCTKEGCMNLQVSKGLCSRHYQEYKRVLRSTKPCPGCGIGIVPESEYCSACRRKGPYARFCADCGQRISHTAHKDTKRCWSCHLVSRRASAIPKICSVEGCSRPHKAKGFCLPHYQTERRRKEYLGSGDERPQSLRVRRGDLIKLPCQVCGYSRLPSRLHRYIPGAQGGKYTMGNIVLLCSNCHEEVHRGLIPCPRPISDT